MKKITLILLAFCLAAGIVMAQEDEGIGLYVGAEMFIIDFSEISDTMGLRGFVGYEHSFNALDVYAEAGVDIPMNDAFIGLDINGGVNYNIEFSDTSNLKFGGGLWIFLPFDDEKGTYTNVTPYGTYPGAFIAALNKFNLHINIGVTYTHTLSIGDLYFGLDMPFLLIADGPDPFDIAELNFTAGLDMEMGLGFGLTLYNWIGGDLRPLFSNDFFQKLDIFATYETGPLFFGLTFGIPLFEDGIDYVGLAITPEAAYTFDFGLTVYAEMPIEGLGAEDGVTLGLTVGAKYSF